jgi:hypothetical protein
VFKDRYEKVKLHVKEHKEAYIVGAIGVTVVAGVLILKRRPIIIAAPVFNNNNLPVFNNIVNNAGHCCKIVQDVATEELWPKAKTLAIKIAEENDVTVDRARWLLSRHLNGADGYETLFGRQYVTYGIATTG